MFFGRWSSWRAANVSRSGSRFTLCLCSAGLLAGCGEAGSSLADSSASYEPLAAWSQTEVNVTPVVAYQTIAAESADLFSGPPALLPQADSIALAATDPQPIGRLLPPQAILAEPAEAASLFPAPASAAANSAALIRLPTVEKLLRCEAVAAELPERCEAAPIEQQREQPVEQHNRLLIARSLPRQTTVAQREEAGLPTTEFSPPRHTEIAAETLAPTATSLLPALEELAEQEGELAALLKDSTSATTGVLTDRRVDELAKTKIQQAYTMASRGALYVARQELIEVLRMVSQAKDAQQGSPTRTIALAAGLRALREAEDFAPRGTQLEAELDINVLCASHRTPIAKQPESAQLLPRLMMDRYLRYAQLQLAMAVAGEPAGSMALHALGKLSSQLGRVEPTKHRLADRHAIAYQQAALLAHNQNHLAAHELGVLLASSGHFVEAEQLLLQVAAREANAVVYHNLASVQDRLGQLEPARANRDMAHQLSQLGATGTNNVQWVSPDQFVQASAQSPPYATARDPTGNPIVVPGSRPTARTTNPTSVRR